MWQIKYKTHLKYKTHIKTMLATWLQASIIVPLTFLFIIGKLSAGVKGKQYSYNTGNNSWCGIFRTCGNIYQNFKYSYSVP